MKSIKSSAVISSQHTMLAGNCGMDDQQPWEAILSL